MIPSGLLVNSHSGVEELMSGGLIMDDFGSFYTVPAECLSGLETRKFAANCIAPFVVVSAEELSSLEVRHFPRSECAFANRQLGCEPVEE